MLRRTVTFCAALLLGVSAIIVDAQQRAVSVRSTGLIVGQVVDAGSGRPVGGAIVSLAGVTVPARSGGTSTITPGPGTQPRILTGADGYFVFRDLPPGNFGILATKPGYAGGAHGRRRPDGLAQPLTLEEGERLGNVVIQIWKHAAISGMVVDEAGEPVIGATVRAYRRSFNTGNRRYVNASGANTDDRGIYRISGLLPGEYIVSNSSRQIAVPLSMAMDSPGARGEGGTPLQVGDSLYSIGVGGAIPPSPADHRLFIYPPTFHIAAPTASEAATVVITSGEDRDGIDLHLRPVRTVRVSGTVTGPTGPAFATTVRLLPADRDRIAIDQDVPEAMTDSAGAFTFPAVPPGDYSFRTQVHVGQPSGPAAPVQGLWARLPLTVGETDLTNVAVVLQTGLRIAGGVAFEGTSNRSADSPRFTVSIDSADPDLNVFASAVVSTNGQFVSPGLPAGRYFVRVAGSPVGWMFKSASYNGVDLSETPIDLSTDISDVVMTFTDRWTGMRGAVHTAQGQADGRTIVLIFPTEPQRWSGYGSSPRRMRSVRASKTGEFSVTSMPAGDYNVIAIADDRGADWQDPSFLETLARAATRITLNEGDQKTLDLRTREVR